MIKVLIISAGHNEINGGIERHCKSLIKLFDNDNSISIRYLDDISINKIPIINKYYYNWKELYHRIKKTDANIIHIHGYLHPCVFQVFLISTILNKNVVFSPHFHPFKYINNPFCGKLFYSFFIRPFLNSISTIITLNNDDSYFFRKYHYVMIPHWINTPNKYTGIKRKEKCILFVGRNDNNKGIDHLYQLPINTYEVHCVTNGILQRKDFIQHTNISDYELEQLYHEASVLVVPSKYEAFSLVAMEALIRGCPILISNQVRIADYLDGLSGVKIFNYGDYESFLNSIPIIMQDTVQIEQIYSIFSPARIKEMYKKVYTEAFNK